MHHVTIGPAVLICSPMEAIVPHLPRVDACVSDPPYGIQMARRGTLGTDRAAACQDYGTSDWDDQPLSAANLALLRSKSRWQILFGGNFFPVPPSSCWLVWDKHTTGDYADCELAWTNLPGAVRRISWLWNGMIRKGDDVRVHPTQKPVGVMRWCLGQLPAGCVSVMDPYMGSGSGGVAAVLEGMAFVGIERDENYFRIACRRIEAAWRAKQSELPLVRQTENQKELFA